MTDQNEPWWDIDESHIGEALSGCVAAIESAQSATKTGRALDGLSVYLGRRVASLDSLDSEVSVLRLLESYDPDTAPDIPLFHFAAQMIRGRVAARQRPKPTVLTSGANYDTRLQARKRTKFLQGQFAERQGEYPTLYDVGMQVFLDSMWSEFGAVHVEPDWSSGKISVRRVHSWDVFFDQEDARAGYPTCVYLRRYASLEALIDAYPEHAEELRAGAPKTRCTTWANGSCLTVWEAWRRRRGKDRPGCHVIVVGDTVLLREDWSHDAFPVAVFRWETSVSGVSGVPPALHAALPQAIANELYRSCWRNSRMLSGGSIDYEQGTYVDESALEDNTPLKLMPRIPGRPAAQVNMPPPFRPEVLQLAQLYDQMVFRAMGTNDLTAQGKAERGLQSGIALRNSTELQDLTYLTQARALEQWYVDVATIMLDVTTDMVERGEQPTALLPSDGGFLESIDWKSIRVGDEDLYWVQIQPGSTTGDGVGGRLEFITEMQAAGWLTAAEAERLSTQGNHDLEAFASRRQAQYNWVERIIAEILDSEDGEEHLVEGPDPYMSLLDALRQVNEAYLEVSSWPTVPESKRKALRDWMTQCIDMIRRASPQAPPASPAVPSGAPPMTPASPGADGAGLPSDLGLPA